jgi:CRP/FNR family cyclic AMP-dependent transcriptional regulator
MDNIVQSLMSTALGKELTHPEAETLVEASESQRVAAGAVLFETGAPGDSLFVILEGSLEVWIGKPLAGGTKIATLGPGQIVGELEVMTRSSRVASLAAAEDTTVLAMPSAKLNHMLEQNDPAATKLVLTIARTLARRLAAVNQRVVKGAPLPPTDASATPAPPPMPKPTPKPAAAAQQQAAGAVTPMTASDAIPIEDDDLAVLDELWS